MKIDNLSTNNDGNSTSWFNLPSLPSRDEAIKFLGNNTILAVGLAFAAVVAVPVVTAGVVFAFTVQMALSIALASIALVVGLVALRIILRKELSDDNFEADLTNKDHSPKRRDTVIDFLKFDFLEEEEEIIIEDIGDLINTLVNCENNNFFKHVLFLIKVEKFIQSEYEKQKKNKEVVYVSLKFDIMNNYINNRVLLKEKLKFVKEEIQVLLADSQNLPENELLEIFRSYPKYFTDHLGAEISPEGMACIIDELVESYLNTIPENND